MTAADRRWLLPAAAGVLFAGVAVISFHGVWLVLAFALLQIALVRAISHSKALDRLGLEEICIGPSLVIIRLTQRGKNTEVALARQHLQVRLHRASPVHKSQLTLECAGRVFEIGAVLSESERCALACALNALIGLASQASDTPPHRSEDVASSLRDLAP